MGFNVPLANKQDQNQRQTKQQQDPTPNKDKGRPCNKWDGKQVRAKSKMAGESARHDGNWSPMGNIQAFFHLFYKIHEISLKKTVL